MAFRAIERWPGGGPTTYLNGRRNIPPPRLADPVAAAILVGVSLGVLAGFIASVGLGLYYWGRLLSVGGLELGLGHAVANPARRARFVWTVGLSFGVFVAAGVVDALSQILGSAAVWELLSSALLLAGGLGLLTLIASALRPTVLSLEEEWRLAESAARASSRSGGQPPPG